MVVAKQKKGRWERRSVDSGHGIVQIPTPVFALRRVASRALTASELSPRRRLPALHSTRHLSRSASDVF